MACFIVPTAEAVITTAVKKAADKSAEKSHEEIKNPFLKRMNWLNTMLWGGSALLAFEHVWHGEITPWFPFLTNASNMGEVLREMSTAGVLMTLLTTAAWAVAVLAASAIEKRSAAEQLANEGSEA